MLNYVLYITNYMKKYISLGLAFVLFVSFYVFASAKTFAIKGKIVDLTTNAGIGGVAITGTNVPSGVITDSKGRFEFSINTGLALFKEFTIATPAVSGAQGVYASQNNVSNFWEINYLDQVAGVACRLENVFCAVNQVLRDKASSALYDFAVEPMVTCPATSSTPAIIPSPPGVTGGYATSDPGVATDGVSALVAMRGNNEHVWLNISSGLTRNKWKGWLDAGGGIKASTAPAPRALARNKFAIFLTGTDDKKYAILLDASQVKTPFVAIPDSFAFTRQDKIKFQTTKYQFSKTSDNKIQFQQCP